MSISITIGEDAPKDLAGKIAAWESVADRHMASGGARVMRGSAVLSAPPATSAAAIPSAPAARPAPRAVVGSGSSILYKGTPLTQDKVAYFLGDMFSRIDAEQRKAGKHSVDASRIARDECNKWRDANLQGGLLRATAGGA